MKDLNIVFVNYKMRKNLEKALPSILADIKDCKYNIQITVADNSENVDNLKEYIVDNFPSIHYVDCGGNVGFAKGNNIGFNSAEARCYMALNCDTIIPEGTQVIERMIDFMDTHPKIGCIGPKLLNTDGLLQYTCYRFNMSSILIKPLKQIHFDKKYAWIKKHTDKLEMKDFDHNQTRPVDWVLGAAMMVRKEVVDEIGWFDDRYFMYLEDADWCHRMWDVGWPVYYVNDIVIQHVYNRESAKVPGIIKALFKNKLARIHLISWLKYIWKWRHHYRYYAKLS